MPTNWPISILEALGEYQGACAVCGAADIRHRIADTIAERHQAGESVANLSIDYNLPIGSVAAVVFYADRLCRRTLRIFCDRCSKMN